MKNISYLAATLAIALTGCATMIDHSSQKVNFQVVGATEVMCDIEYAGLKYVVRPPQTITLTNSRHDMELTCQAAGNRFKRMTIPSSLSGWTATNISNGILLGTTYDAASGAMFKFPEVIMIDFSDTVATMDKLPDYEAVDGLDPRVAGTEPLGPSWAKLPGDDARALRHRMAKLQRDQDDALEAERETRQESVEGGWDGDKGGSGNGAALAPADMSAQPPLSMAPDNQAPLGDSSLPTLQPPSGEAAPVTGGHILNQPVFPSTTSFNP